MKYALFVCISRSMPWDPSSNEDPKEPQGEWRFEGWIDNPKEWLDGERHHAEADNGAGCYLLVPMPDGLPTRDDGDEIKTRIHVSLERPDEDTPITGYLFEYEQQLDRPLASDISMDIGEWLEENAD